MNLKNDCQLKLKGMPLPLPRRRILHGMDVAYVMLLGGLTAQANPIGSSEAILIAEQFLGKEVQALNLPRKSAGTATAATPSLHILNASDGKGFVVVSGDDRIMPVLAYSDNGQFDPQTAPESALWLISEYQKAIEAMTPDAPAAQRRLPRKNPVKRSPSVEPLLSTQWGQGDPYNNQCPSIGGINTLTGCVATAMAQVVNYENKTSTVAAVPEYWYENGYAEGLPSREFSFGNLSEADIAWLMRYCGQSVEMSYGIDASGAESEKVPNALRNYFGWEDEVNLLKREDYNDQHWNRMVAEEIGSGHPLIYSAMSETGIGHSFVVDAVSDDYYHVNWGWEGNSDGYYSFSPFGSDSDNKSTYILWQDMVAARDDDPSNDVIDYGTTINGINYQLSDDMTAAVLPLKGGEKYRGELVIPSTVEYGGDTYTVTYFGQSAFVNCKHLTSISIPATITGQAWSIFDGCENLHKVNIEDLTSFIKLDVGGWWTGSPLTYGADLYLNGEIVRDLVIPEGIENVGYCKFANCTSVETITFPSTIKVAGQYSFSGCPKLRYVDMLESALELIGELAFVNDDVMEEVRLPATLNTIKPDAFGQGCRKLRKVVSLATTPPNAEGTSTIGKGIAFTHRTFSDVRLYVPDSSMELYKKAKEWRNFCEILPISEEKPLPEVDTISAGPLIYEINLTEKFAKVISINIDYIPSEGNDDRIILIPTYVVYSDQNYPVEEIGYETFYGKSYENFEIQAPVRKLGISAFCWSTIENGLKLPDTLNSIPESAFRNFSTSKLILPASLDYIGENALCAEENISYYDLSGNGILEIESLNPLPPTVCDNTFDAHQFEHTILRVPYGSKKAYSIASGWSNFKNIENIGDEQEIILNNDLTISATLKGKTSLRNGMPLHVTGTVFNRGSQSVTGFKLKWNIDGNDSDEKSFGFEIMPNESSEFDIYIPVNVSNSGSHVLNISAMINDDIQDDDTSDNVAELNFDTFDNGYYRVSLIEQFTSENCGLTPSANPKVYNAIEQTDNADFVAHVFNHCGYYDDFLTLTHDYEWFYNDWGTYTPAIMLNRTDIANSGYTPVMSVADRFEFDLQNESGICNAMVSVSCDLQDNNISVKTVLDKDASFDIAAGYDYVTVFLIEDSIPAREQIDVWTDGYLQDYYHRNVLRKVLTSPWGERIKWDGDSCLYRFKTDINPEWNKDNLSAVAFIHRYNPDSPTDCQVYTAGASYQPQYREIPDDSADWIVWDSNGADKVELNISELTMSIDEEGELTATVTPDNAIGTIIWTSSDDYVVSITETSDDSSIVSIKANAPGTAIITASTPNGKSASCTIYVSILTENIIIEGLPEGEIHVGDKFRLTAWTEPWNATDPSVNWSSDNEEIAAVDNDGNVEILAEGSTIIRATANDGSGCEALCYIDAISGIEVLIDDSKPFSVYDINGHLILMEADRSDLEALPRGVYILVQSNSTCKFIR